MTRFAFEARGGRLDAVTAEQTGIARAEVQRAIEQGRVTVDGTVRPKSYRLHGGERIEGETGAGELPPPEPGGVPVRYEDERLLLVSKPAGLVTHPTERRKTGTLVNRLLGMQIPLSTVGGPDRPGIVHRLDAGTSGLLVVAKDDETHRALARMFADHAIARRYVALVRGDPAHDAFTIEAPLGRRGARVAVSRPTGREATTDVRVVERLARGALVEARPRTGRTHQIRVHLASVGHPVLGDRTYGGGGGDARTLGLARPFLHAAGLSFIHPIKGVRIDLDEPLPSDLESALERAGAA